MKNIIVIIACLHALLTLNLTTSNSCCGIDSRQFPYYKLIKSNVRSNQLILSTAMVPNVNECRKFALTKKALAFNYGLQIDNHGSSIIQNKNRSKITRKMCEALQCPEIHNFTTVVRNKNYKYYSTYPSFVPINGSSFTLACIPRTGVFVFSNNSLNYSQAQTACQKMNASLAHIISEERTIGLAKYISLNTPTLVGLSIHDDEKSNWKNEFDEALACFNYRAWGKGEPSHSKGCVGLIQPAKTVPGPFWKVLPCDTILPFICEISPMFYRHLHN